MTSSHPHWTRLGWNLFAASMLACLACSMGLGIGCKRTEEPPQTTREGGTAPSRTETQAPAKETPSAEKGPAEELTRPEPAAMASKKTVKEVLDGMVAAYKKAPSYADQGTLRLRATQGGQKDEKSYDYSLVFARPNKIRLQVYEGVLVCDGRELVAFANDLPDQVAKRPAPAKVDLKALFADRIFGSAISQGPTQGFSWVPIPLLLMVADDPLKTILAGSPKTILLEPAKIGEHECYRVQLTRPDGTAVLWIDRRTSVLRRMEFPVEMFLRAPSDQKLDDISMVAEFQAAGLGDQLDDAIFRHEIPPKAQVGDWLMPPPLLMLGKPAPEFAFVGADGKPIDSKSLAGKVVVLDFWATWCKPCRVSMPILDNLYKKYKDNAKIRFLAVSVDEKKTEDKELKTVLDDLAVTIPFARDPEQHAGKRFGVQGIPSLCVLGLNNTIQVYETGYRPGLDDELAKKIDGLLAGQDAYRDQITQFEAAREKYTAWLDRWIEKGVYVASGGDDVEVPEAKILPRTDPKAFALEPLWKCADTKMPGNMLAVPATGGAPRLFVIDSLSAVLEIGAGGKVAATRSLDLPERQAVTMIRTAAGADGKRFYAVSGLLQQQVYLFDENWKKVLTFPEDALKNPHAGIWDVQLADVNADGKLELLVGYNGDVGVQCVSLEGQRIWSYRSLAMVSRLGLWVPDPKGPRYVLCTNESGSLVLLDAQGKPVPDALGRRQEIKVPNRGIYWFLAADLLGDQTMLLSGIFPPEPGVYLALGIDPRGAELWNYPLPKGDFSKRAAHVERIVAGNLAPSGPGQWLIPGPDGSIAAVAPDGRVIDRWQTGSAVAGLTTMNVDGQPVLVVAMADAVEAWRVKWPAAQK